MKIRIEWVFAVLLATIMVLIVQVLFLRISLKNEINQRQSQQEVIAERTYVNEAKVFNLFLDFHDLKREYNSMDIDFKTMQNHLSYEGGLINKKYKIQFLPVLIRHKGKGLSHVISKPPKSKK